MFIQSGSQCKFRLLAGKSTGRASVLEVHEGSFEISVPCGLVLNQGDEIELEFSPGEDALYLINASVLEGSTAGVYTLQEKGEPRQLQRRWFQRIPTSLKAGYVPRLHKAREQKTKQGLILNISNGGVLLSVEESLEPNFEIWLDFELPLGPEKIFSIRIGGKVVRQHSSQENCYGIKFDWPLTLLTA